MLVDLNIIIALCLLVVVVPAGYQILGMLTSKPKAVSQNTGVVVEYTPTGKVRRGNREQVSHTHIYGG